MLNVIELLHDKCTDNARHLKGFYIAAVSAANKKEIDLCDLCVSSVAGGEKK